MGFTAKETAMLEPVATSHRGIELGYKDLFFP